MLHKWGNCWLHHEHTCWIVVGIKEWIIYMTRLLYGNIALKTCFTKRNRFWNLTFSLHTGDRQTPRRVLLYFFVIADFYCIVYIIENMDIGTFPDRVSFYFIWFMSLLGSFSPVTSFQEALTDRVLIKPCCLRFLLTYLRLQWALYQTKTFKNVYLRSSVSVWNISVIVLL